jgi:cell division septation protein DedD
MDWLRRNWPDLTIGVALVAVIALIVATLLSGGSLASLVRRDNPPEIPVTNTTGNTTENTAGTDSTDTASTGETEGTADMASGTDARATGDGAGADDIDVFVPGIPNGQAAGAADGGAGSGTNGNQVLPTLPGDAETVGAGVAETAAGPLPEASEAGGFRVAAGALDSRDAAGTLAQSYRDDGYEVLVEQQGDLYLLWIGPYATREDADTAAARIVADGGDALVYTYSGEDAGDDTADGADANPDEAGAQTSEAVTDAAPDTASRTANNTANRTASNTANTANTTTANTAARTPQAGQAANAATGQRYLQVGAFAADENAQPLRDQLEQLGFDIVINEDAGGLVRVFVGPFGSAQLMQAQSRLDAQGIDSFPVVR